MNEKPGETLKDIYMSIIEKFNEHPSKNQMTYKEHLIHAWKLGLRSAFATGCFFIHGLFPMTLESTGSETINTIHKIIRLKQIDNELFSQ